MRVATWRGNDRFTLDEAPEPVAGPGQVVVSVRAAGICGTDIHATQGLFPWTPPLVLGHEYTGVVQRGGTRRPTVAGRARRRLRALVRLRHLRRLRGGPDQPVRQVRAVGGFSERVALPARRSIPCRRSSIRSPPRSPSRPRAACPASRCTRCRATPRVLVIGGGIMGLLTMVLAKRRGARRLVLSDPIEERRQIANRLGAAIVDRSHDARTCASG